MPRIRRDHATVNSPLNLVLNLREMSEPLLRTYVWALFRATWHAPSREGRVRVSGESHIEVGIDGGEFDAAIMELRAMGHLKFLGRIEKSKDLVFSVCVADHDPRAVFTAIERTKIKVLIDDAHSMGATA